MFVGLPRLIFVIVTMGIISLNHVTLGYCQCFGAFLASKCQCHHSCDEHEHEHEHCDSCHSAPKHNCPCEEGDCSTYFWLELEEFSVNGEIELPGGEANQEQDLNSWVISIPKLFDSLHSRWYPVTGPPWAPGRLHLRFSVFLI